MLSARGWITTKAFHSYLLKVYIPHTKSSLATPSILIVDNHSTRYDIDTVALCMASGVDLMMLPPNCTHFAQPLDRTCFGPLKLSASKLDWQAAVDQHAHPRQPHRIDAALPG